MIYKEYGKTGKEVSALGFGGMRFDIENNSIEENAQLVRRASELGINYFDTAHSYCKDQSEIIYGEAFKEMPNPFYVSTKSMVTKDPTADDVRRRVETSLQRMGLEKIDFFHMWCILDLDMYQEVIKKGGPYEGALKLKEEGLIDHICFSTHANGDEIEQIINDDLFEGVILGYNATNFAYREQGVKAAYQNNLGVVTMNPLGGGVIPQNPDFYSFIKDNPNDTVAQAALKFNIAHEEITIALAGINNIEELEENVAAVNSAEGLSNEKIEEIKDHLKEELDALCTGCGYCLGCPEDIYIPTYMMAYNEAIIRDDQEIIADKIDGARKHGPLTNRPESKANSCIECGLCESQCTQHLPIIERLKEFIGLEE
ncbi:aldo/keto reductase [Natroniella sulfidigena]|uniref:aldo/keto reductase n=1 Tax=Natroniella sulfidigena TaxID=723921 RepID=UPI00200AADCF|nr:aldo/keto reductase [Natroniella sulfidigena]MCK8817351.1 aldo/keto reductase [Natroniella sulfidigena]